MNISSINTTIPVKQFSRSPKFDKSQFGKNHKLIQFGPNGYSQLLEEYSIKEIFQSLDEKFNKNIISKEEISYNPGKELKEKLRIQLGEYDVSLRRTVIFYLLGTTCVKSGVEGKKFILTQSSNGSIHLDLFAYEKDGFYEILTIDHKIPVSKGGGNNLDNLQPMLSSLNQEKDNTI